MRIDRIPSRVARTRERDLVSRARSAFPCWQQQKTRLFVLPAFANAVAQLGLGTTTPAEGSPSSGPGRADNRVLPLADHDARLHLRPVKHGGALAWLWRGRLAGIHRSLRELEITRCLKARGAPVPTPVLVFARRRLFLFEVSVGSLHEEDTVDLLTFLAKQPSREFLTASARLVAHAVRRFHDCGGVHPDLHAGNLLVSTQSARPRAVVVDLDRARLLEEVSASRRMRELMRLYRSLRKHGLLSRVGRDGLTAFFEAYTEGDLELERHLLENLPAEKRRERIHAFAWRLLGHRAREC